MLQSIPWDGSPISIAGCYSGVPLNDYHRANICVGPSVSSTALRKIYAYSPAHYWDESPINPRRVLPDPTRAEAEWRIIGRAAHHLLVGAVGAFDREYIIQPLKYPAASKDPAELREMVKLGWTEEYVNKKWNNNTTYCKNWGIAKRTAGITIMTEDHVKTIEGMAISLGRDPLIGGGKGVLDGLIEQSIFWKDKETGLWLKSRPDVVPTDSCEPADFKTTQSVLWNMLQYALDDLGYYQQGALIGDGLKAVFNMDMTCFSLVWVEKKRPHCVRITPLYGEDLVRGQLRNRVAMRTFAECHQKFEECQKSGADPAQYDLCWPGPAISRTGDELASLQLSTAARDRIDRRLRFEGMIV
jgi:hypothetical protein